MLIIFVLMNGPNKLGCLYMATPFRILQCNALSYWGQS